MDELADIKSYYEQLDAAEQDARALVAGLDETRGQWKARPDAWSIAQCLDHLGNVNRAYLAAMEPVAAKARGAGRKGSSTLRAGVVGGWFARSMEPPVKAVKMKSPKTVVPRQEPALEESFASFLAVQAAIREFVRKNADLDLSSIRFRNPFVPVLRFRVAAGLLIMTAHERRHIWQAWQVRKAQEAQPSAGLP
jgi:hypothetical protein